MTACRHARKGVVTSRPGNGSCSHAPVCERPECIAEAIAWAKRWTGQAAHHTPDLERSAS
jgi:hypothetical protein